MIARPTAILLASVTLIGLSMVPGATAANIQVPPTGCTLPLLIITFDNTATFTNNCTVGHHPIADDGCFDAGFMPPGSVVTVDLSGCGDVISYHCAIHALTERGVIVKG